MFDNTRKVQVCPFCLRINAEPHTGTSKNLLNTPLILSLSKDEYGKSRVYIFMVRQAHHERGFLEVPIHLLLETGEVPLSRIMQSLQFTYTQKFNRRHKKVGHLFQGRYKAILCQKESYLLELIRYIVLNPVRARLVKRPVDWRWNSYFDLLRLKEGHVVSFEEVLALFGTKPAGAATKELLRRIVATIKKNHRPCFVRATK